MCGRFPVLTFDELREVVDNLVFGTAFVPLPDWPLGTWPAGRDQAFPGSVVRVIAPASSDVSDGSDSRGDFDGANYYAVRGDDDLALSTPQLTWGVTAPWKPGQLVFNTRIETALRDCERNGGMWGSAIADARCVVASAGFFEPHATEREVSATSGKLIKRSYMFGIPGGQPLLMGGLVRDGRFTVVTTQPNASVSPVHNRMPLVLSPDEARQWLWGSVDDVAALDNRERIELVVRPEREIASVAKDRGVDSKRGRDQLTLF